MSQDKVFFLNLPIFLGKVRQFSMLEASPVILIKKSEMPYETCPNEKPGNNYDQACTQMITA